MSFGLVAALVLTGCASEPPPLTDTERDEIAETITRMAATIDVKGDRPECEAALQVFSGREPVVASDGQTYRTTEELKPMCPETATPSRFDVEQSDAHVLSRDHAYVVRRGLISFEPAGQTPTRFIYAVTDIFERLGGQWKLAHHHESFQPVEEG
jgi:hypothetical protein